VIHFSNGAVVYVQTNTAKRSPRELTW